MKHYTQANRFLQKYGFEYDIPFLEGILKKGKNK